MKKTLIFTLIALFFAAKSIAQVVNIPDANFKSYLVSNTEINTNGDSEIQQSEAVAYNGAISANSKGIKSLIGIEAFVNIKVLYCYNNSLTALDVSKNLALTDLLCYNNSLTALDVSKNVALKFLDCGRNSLTALDFSKNAELNVLYCSENSLSALDVSKNVTLNRLFCIKNSLTALDVSKNVRLTDLGCYNNALISLNLKNSNNKNLYTLDATSNPSLKCIQVDNIDNIFTSWKKDDTAIFQ